MSDVSTEFPAQARQVFDRTVADLKDGVASATEAYGTASAKATKVGAEFASFNQGTLEALAQAGQVFASEAQDFFRQAFQANQAAVAESLASFRAITGAKSLKEGLELQANFARTAAIWGVTESARFARAGIDMAEKVSAPLTARAYLAAEKVGSYTA